MKKQIFILVFLVVATFASVTNSFGQCAGDALHPIAGKKYTYTITASPTGGTFNWYVVTSADLMPATSTKADGTYVTGGTGYNAPGTGTASVDITWSSKAVKDAQGATPVKFYLVINYAITGCTDNLKAYAVAPLNLFQILVQNVTSAGVVWTAADATAGICRSAVKSATVNGAGIDYDFGSNALYLKITANYFTTSWTPKIDITALKASLNAGQTITSIEYSLTTTFTGTSNFDLATGVATTPVAQIGTTTDGTDQVIYVKVIIADSKFEGTTDQNVAFNVSAVDASLNPDVDKDASCADITPDPDNLTQLLKGRPAITSATPITIPAAGTGVFLVVNP